MGDGDDPGLTVFAFVHVIISIVGLVAGLVVLYGFLSNKSMGGWVGTFLAFTTLTTLTGFFLPFKEITPAVATGIVSSVVLALTLAARYAFHMAGPWRLVFVIGAVVAQYLNSFVFVVQSFLKTPPLHALAPTNSEPPFALAQGAVLLFYVATGFLAARRFHPQPAMAASPASA